GVRLGHDHRLLRETLRHHASVPFLTSRPWASGDVSTVEHGGLARRRQYVESTELDPAGSPGLKARTESHARRLVFPIERGRRARPARAGDRISNRRAP